MDDATIPFRGSLGNVVGHLENESLEFILSKVASYRTTDASSTDNDNVVDLKKTRICI